MLDNPILEKIQDKIEEIIDLNINTLHDSVREFIFQDVDFYKFVGITPQWLADAGISPELKFSKEEYDDLMRIYDCPIIRRIIYYYDIWNLFAALQDRLDQTNIALLRFFSGIQCSSQYNESDYTNSMVWTGREETYLHFDMNCIFVTLSSSFDIISKIAYEQYHFNEYDFSKYKKMRSNNTLFGTNIRVDDSLKKEGMLFHFDKDVSTIITLRSEFVHNGPWDRRCSVYCTSIEGEIGDSIIYCPDIDNNGRFVCSGSRNKFYSQGYRMNIELPNMVYNILKIIQKTIDQLTIIYKKNTIDSIDDEKTLLVINEINALKVKYLNEIVHKKI